MANQVHIPSGRDYTKATPDGECRVEYPFASPHNDLDTFTITQRMVQLKPYWEPAKRNTQFDAGLVHADGVNLPMRAGEAILLEETTPRDMGANFVTWERIWGNIPSPRREPGILTWLRPGLYTETVSVSRTITSIVNFFDRDNRGWVKRMTVNDASGLSTGITVKFTFYRRVVDRVIGNIIRYRWEAREAQSVILGIESNTLTLEWNSTIALAQTTTLLGGPTGMTFGPLLAATKRLPRAVPVPILWDVRYELLEDPEGLTVSEPFTIFTSTGEETDTVTDTTTPTYTQYAELIQNKTLLQADAPQILDYLGDIKEIRTPLVRAQ